MPAREIHRLPKTYKSLKPGLHCDGGNLYLQVSEGASGNRRRSWVFRYALPGGKNRDMGLGSAQDFSLADAREIAHRYRLLLREGIDPIARRDAERAKNLAASVAAMTFDEAAQAYVRQHGAAWTNLKHAKQWSTTVTAYASPVIGRMAVADITTANIMKILEPIWQAKPETASRLRGRIENILGWAAVSGYRSGENPARWKDHLDNLLPSKTKVRAVKHQVALPYQDMPAFIAELRTRSGMAALALEFAIFTCVRTADVRNARHADIDRVNGTWTISVFSKTGKEHKVPLSTAAIAVFDRARATAQGIGGAVGRSELTFPNDITGKRLSDNAMLWVLDRMGRKCIATTHGFRSSFRTWALEASQFPWELCEMSLGHMVGSKVERAYQRGDGFEKRIAIMQAWANFCDRPVGDVVVPLGKRPAA